MRQSIIFCVLAIVAALGVTAHAGDITIQLQVEGRQLEGNPVFWNKKDVYLLQRDGQLSFFNTKDASNFRQSSSMFRSYSQSEIRRSLLAEFGSHFDVSGTGQYLVVHPAGQRDQWASRFEELYRSFVHYFSVRGFRPRQPQFPFVAVVFHRQQDFLKYAASTGARVGPGVLGYYSPSTNRILLYDQTAGRGGSGWQENAETIIHEAAHQAAFNTGIHSRFAHPPRWVAEGIGMMFESRGVYDSGRYTTQGDRINLGRLRSFKSMSAGRRKKGSLAEMISSDRVFQADPLRAYAEAWALTFYLAETQPRKYFQYLSKTAGHKPFTKMRAPERLQEFTSVFGENFAMLDAQLTRFIEGLK